MNDLLRINDIVLTPLEMLSVRRTLELLASGAAMPGGIYNNPFDANWLGFGVGFCRAHGFIDSSGPSTYEITVLGREELEKHRRLNTPRLPDGIVPTTMRDKRILMGMN